MMTKTLRTILFVAAAWAAVAAQAQEPAASSAAKQTALPAGVAQQGTFARAGLLEGSTRDVVAVVATRGCNSPERLTPYVVTAPTGDEGRRQWKERWIVAGCGQQYPVNIQFKETGPGSAAIWVIEK